MFAVKINNLSHSINGHNILKNINLELEKDKIACILGPSGCGKTTLLKLIAGLEKAKSGETTVLGVNKYPNAMENKEKLFAEKKKNRIGGHKLSDSITN